MKRIVLLLVAIVLALGICAPVALAHYGTHGAVNPANERLIWDDDSIYAVYDAAANWDRYNCAWHIGADTCPGVDIDNNPADTSVAPDVEIKDFCDASSPAAAMTRNAPDPDQILMNRCKISGPGWTQAARIRLATHEFGHTLAMDHTPKLAGWCKKSIMYPDTSCLPLNLVNHDIVDYYYRFIYPTYPFPIYTD